MEITIRGKVYVCGDNVDTDVIIPARYLTSDDDAELGKHAMEDYLFGQRFLNPDGSSDYKIIVAGSNFGCGSSREQAPRALRAAGIEAVVAKSFARIFFRNCVNLASIYPLEIEEPIVISNGDVAEVRFSERPTFEFEGNVYPALPLTGPPFEIMKAGGLVNYIRAKYQSENGS